MGVEESISALVERAKAERDSVIEKIKDMLDTRFVELLQDSQAIVKSFNNIREMLGLEINLENTMEDFLRDNENKLINVANILSKIKISKENLMGEEGTYIGNAQSLLEKMELAINEAKTNLLKSLENQIIMAYQNKMQLNGKSGIVVEEVAIQDGNEETPEIVIEEVSIEGKNKRTPEIVIDDVDIEDRNEGIVIEDVNNVEDSSVAENDVKKSFSERIRARITGKNSSVINNRNNKPKEENIK